MVSRLAKYNMAKKSYAELHDVSKYSERALNDWVYTSPLEYFDSCQQCDWKFGCEDCTHRVIKIKRREAIEKNLDYGTTWS